jgi:hypothetical protein
MRVGSVHDLETPVVPILACLLAFGDHGAGLGERVLSGNLKAGVRLPFSVVDEAARRPDVEVLQSRMGLVLGREMQLVGRMPGARRTALIVPPSEVVTLARSPGSLAHADIEQRRAGILMSIKPRTILVLARPLLFPQR